jgi:hypothetical protein
MYCKRSFTGSRRMTAFELPAELGRSWNEFRYVFPVNQVEQIKSAG